MSFGCRRLLEALVALALLWQASAATAAALMGCCQEQAACCLVSSAQSACGTCAPTALGAPAQADPQRLTPTQGPPTHALPASGDAAVPDIWRPPQAH